MQNSRDNVNSVNSTTEKALVYIRDGIFSGLFPAGTLLPTKNLAEEIGVSRTPVRDALRQLESEGLVTIAPRQEARVKELSLEEEKAIGELRIAMHVHAAQLAALRRTKEDLEIIRRHHQTFADWAARPLPHTPEEATAVARSLEEANEHFHLAILDAARNSRLKAEALRFALIQKLARLSLRSESVTPCITGSEDAKRLFGDHSLEEASIAHAEILHAIEIQSTARAFDAMRTHLEDELKRRLRALKAIRDHEMQRALDHPGVQ